MEGRGLRLFGCEVLVLKLELVSRNRKNRKQIGEMRLYKQLMRIHWKTDINLNYIYRLSPYRAGNTFRLSYKNQPVRAVQ